MQDMPLSVFISYAHTDITFVDDLEAALKTHGFHTWVDRSKLEGGDEWLDKIQQAIESCHVLLVVLSPDAIASKYVKMEYRYAQSEGKVVIPLHWRSCTRVPIDLNGIQWVNFLNADDNALQELLRMLGHLKPSLNHIKPSSHFHQEMIDRVQEATEPPLVSPQPTPAPQDQRQDIDKSVDQMRSSNGSVLAISNNSSPQQPSVPSKPEADHIQKDEKNLRHTRKVHPNPEVVLQEIVREIYAHIDPRGATELPPLFYEPASVADPDRRRFLNHLHAFYTNTLKQSLQGATLISLGLQTRPDAVIVPAQLMFRNLSTQTEQLFPPETSITEAYDIVGGELFILGEPGAGKSTLLLHLAQNLLARAIRDNQHLLPVIVNLSSWAAKRQPLSVWLVEDLHVKYPLPLRLCQQWVENGQLLLLLDGLDEVAASARSACIDAIHAYRRDHIVPLVVCSRTTDYFSQPHRLELPSAVIVQPLEQEEVDEYLVKVGPSLAALRAVLQQNIILRALAVTPLMLNVMIQTYRDSSVTALPEIGSIEEQQREVFASYVMRMLLSNRIDQPQQFLTRLAWLARQMREHGQTTFYLEQLQPSWLSGFWVLMYYWLAVRLPDIIMGILVTLAVDLSFGPGHASMPYISLILLGGLLGGLLSGERVNQRHPGGENRARNMPWLRWLFQFLVSVFACLGIALNYEQTYRSNSGLSLDLKLVLTPGPGLLLGILLLQVLLEKKNGVQPAHPTRQAIWQRFISISGVRNGLLVGMLVWLGLGLGYGLYDMPFGLSYALDAGLTYGLSHGLSYGLSFGFSSGLLSVLLIGKSSLIQPADLLSWSRGSLKKSLFSMSHISATLKIAIGTGLILGLSAGLSTGLSYGAISTYVLDSGLSSGLSAGLSFGLSYWFLFGLFQSMSSRTIENQPIPNRIVRSAVNGCWPGLSSAVFVALSYVLSAGLNYMLKIGLEIGLRYQEFSSGLEALSYGLNFALSDGLNSGVRNGLLVGISVGLLVWLHHGGRAYLRHYILRLLLKLSRSASWRYRRFLEKATCCILLRREGNGYSFIHSLFLDYIADYSAHLHRKEGDIA